LQTRSKTFTLTAINRREQSAPYNAGKKRMATQQDGQTIERRTIAKVSWRLLPLVALAYCIAYIDRSNISFAALTMNKDLGSAPISTAGARGSSSSAISCSRFRAI
jgi:sugar phosphate permease